MKDFIILSLVIITCLVHGFFVPFLVFPNSLLLALLYAIFSGAAIGTLGRFISELLD